MIFAVHQAEAQFQHLPFSLRKHGQRVLDLFAQHLAGGGFHRGQGIRIFDEIPQLAVFLVAHRAVERHRFLGHLHDAVDARGRPPQAAVNIRGQGRALGFGALDDRLVLLGDETGGDGDLLGGRIALQVLHHLALDAHQAVDGLVHVDGDADGAGLVGDGAADGLADPPGGVGAEFVAAGGVEFGDRPQQAEVAFLNQIQEGVAAPDVAFCHADHQPQVGADQGVVRLVGEFAQVVDFLLQFLLGGQIARKGAVCGEFGVFFEVAEQFFGG